MAQGRRAQVQGLMDLLNSINVGELGSIETKLASVREDLRGLGESEVEKVIEEAWASLTRADLVNFRRLLAQAVAKLGHLR